LELKQEQAIKRIGFSRGLNRTRLELKPSAAGDITVAVGGLNRTRLELKPFFMGDDIVADGALIVPDWN